MKTYLNVPFDQKDRAKHLGAQWEAGSKRWFIEDVDVRPFLAWIPDPLKLPCKGECVPVVKRSKKEHKAKKKAVPKWEDFLNKNERKYGKLTK